jgi:hypothetical protein
MTSVTNPTYLFAPNWNFPLDGPIALGNIVGDPFRPHRSLSKPAADGPAPDIITSVESDWRLELERIRSVNLSLWTEIFDVANLDVGSHRIKATRTCRSRRHLRPLRPCRPFHLRRHQALVFCSRKSALVRNQCSEGKQEPEGASSESATVRRYTSWPSLRKNKVQPRQEGGMQLR